MGGSVGMFVDKVLDRNAGGFRAVAVVAVAALLATWLTVELFAYWRGVDRNEDRQTKMQQAADLLNTQAMGSGMSGAVSLLGLSEPLLKDMARGVLAHRLDAGQAPQLLEHAGRLGLAVDFIDQLMPVTRQFEIPVGQFGWHGVQRFGEVERQCLAAEFLYQLVLLFDQDQLAVRCLHPLEQRCGDPA